MERRFDLAVLLKNHEKKHKMKPSQFVSTEGGIQRRLAANLKKRRSSRLTIFDKIRNLPSGESPPPLSDAQLKVERRRQQLEKWKEDKEKQKKELAAQKKKPFVTGVAHAPLKYVPPPPIVPSTSGRVTRSQTAKTNVTKKVEHKPVKSSQSFAPKNASFRPPQIKNLTKVPMLAPVIKSKKEIEGFVINFNTVPSHIKKNEVNIKQTRSRANKPETESRVSKVVTRKNAKEFKEKINTKSTVSEKQSQRGLKRTKNTTPVKSVPRSESSSEERLRSPKSPGEVPKISEPSQTPVAVTEELKRISPCVTISRGKSNAREEMKKKIKEGLLFEDCVDRDCIEDFRKQLNFEIIRLTEICDKWEKIREQTPLVESVEDEVLGAVGQARLLMSSKLQQFAGLVDRCERPEPGSPLITPTDLQGFWDMVFMQIVNIDIRFKRLEQRKERNWADEQTAQPTRRAPPKNNIKKVSKPAGGPSRLREMIAAARKAKKEEEDSTAEGKVGLVAVSDESKTFEAGFFCVRSPVRSPACGTPNNKASLLKSVLSSEAKKASSSKNTFAILHASSMSKTLQELDGIAPLPQTPLAPINVNATPGRSILKSTNVSKSGKKSIKVVLFDESDTEVQEQNGTDLKESITDSGVSSMGMEKDVENKENSRKKSLVRQNALEKRSPVMTRNRRRSIQSTPQGVKTRSQKSLLQAAENVEVITTPNRRRKTLELNIMLSPHIRV